jgi:hypothetical protein
MSRAVDAARAVYRSMRAAARSGPIVIPMTTAHDAIYNAVRRMCTRESKSKARTGVIDRQAAPFF